MLTYHCDVQAARMLAAVPELRKALALLEEERRTVPSENFALLARYDNAISTLRSLMT